MVNMPFFSLLAFCKILTFYVSCDRSTLNESYNIWKLNLAGSSFVLLKVTCTGTPYGINHIGLVVQDLD